MQVSIEVQVTAGFPIRQVILQEVMNYNASWIVLDRYYHLYSNANYTFYCLSSSNDFQFYLENLNRYLRRDLRFHLNKMPCKVALVKDDLSLDIWRSHYSNDKIVTETKLVYSLSKIVSLSQYHSNQDFEQSIQSCKSYPRSITSSDSSTTIKSYTKHSHTNRSRDHNSSDFGSSAKIDKSGQFGIWISYN